MRANVTKDDFGIFTDAVWLDVDPPATQNIFEKDIVQIWGEVVGPYTYTTVNNGNVTIPEIRVKYIALVTRGGG